MKYRLCVVFLLTALYAPMLQAQDEPPGPHPVITHPFADILPGFGDRAVVLDISSRVVEQNQEVVWHESRQKVTIAGRPVGLKLVGENVVVAAQFTPYLRRKGKNLLVAQGQIWVNIPNQGIRYQTSMQTIPLDFEEPVYFFPLGQHRDQDAAFIEVMLTIRPYIESAIPSEGKAPEGDAAANLHKGSR